MLHRLGRATCIALLGGMLLSACTKLPEDYPTPTPIPTPAESNKPVYTVKRGTIDQVVKALGRIAADQEDILYFRQAGRLYHLAVQTDQKVKKGDLLAELDTGTLKDQVKIAQVQADIGQLKVDQAIAQSGGQTQTAQVAAAQSNVVKAEADYQKAQDALTKLLEGATPGDVQSAKAGIAAAQSQLASAQQKLSDLKAQPRPEDVRAAELDVQQAKNALWSQQLTRDSICGRSGANSGQCKSADADVAAKQTALQAAQTNLEKAKLPATPADLAAAEQAVKSAQASVTSAQAKLADLQSGASGADVDAARQAVASAKAQLDAARSGVLVAQGANAGKDIDVQIAQKNADLAKLQLDQLQQQLDEAQLRAPFDGVVTETDAKDGDQIQSYTPVVTVSNPAKLEIAVELQASDLTQVALGQPATIVLSSNPTAQLQGKIIRMPSIATGNGDNPQLPASLRTVRISFPNPPPSPVNLGDLANVAIDVQKKEGVLILPTTAIRTFGGRRFVRIVTPDGRHREVDIQVGISDDTNTEITKGLSEGDKVVSP